LQQEALEIQRIVMVLANELERTGDRDLKELAKKITSIAHIDNIKKHFNEKNITEIIIRKHYSLMREIIKIP